MRGVESARLGLICVGACTCRVGPRHPRNRGQWDPCAEISGLPGV